MRNQTREYVIKGYFGGTAALFGMHDKDLALVIVLRVNSVKQAQERFVKKYESSLSGQWDFEITDPSGKQLLCFTRSHDGTIENVTDDEMPF